MSTEKSTKRVNNKYGEVLVEGGIFIQMVFTSVLDKKKILQLYTFEYEPMLVSHLTHTVIYFRRHRFLAVRFDFAYKALCELLLCLLHLHIAYRLNPH